MKAAELPINVIVIVVLCLIVLLAILALFSGTWAHGSSTLSLEAAKNNACQMLLSTGCTSSTSSIYVKNFDADKDGRIDEASSTSSTNPSSCNNPAANTGDNLAMLCLCWYNVDETTCKNRICGCE